MPVTHELVLVDSALDSHVSGITSVLNVVACGVDARTLNLTAANEPYAWSILDVNA